MRIASHLTVLCALLASSGPLHADSTWAAAEELGSDQVSPPPDWKIESVRTSGSGCPTSGTPPVVWISPEGDAIDVELGFKVDLTASDARPERSASCTLIIGLRVPPGYAYAPTHLRVGGRSLLPAGVQAALVTTYGYQGSGLVGSNVTQRLATPSALESFDFADDFATGSGREWSRCGEQQLLNVTMVLHLRNTEVKQTGWAELSSATALQIAWKRCP